MSDQTRVTDLTRWQIQSSAHFKQPLSCIGQSRGTANDLPTLPALQHFSRTNQIMNRTNVVLGKFSHIFVRLSCLRSSNSFLYFTKTWNRVSDVVKATSESRRKLWTGRMGMVESLGSSTEYFSGSQLLNWERKPVLERSCVLTTVVPVSLQALCRACTSGVSTRS